MNCMKKIIPLFAAICLFAACEKGPDMGKLDSNYLVYTNFDKSAKFDSFETFYLPDSLLIIGENKSAVYASDNESLGILNAFASNMAAKGYVRVDNREEADLGLQVSYVESTYYLTDYTYPQWWWGYPGYCSKLDDVRGTNSSEFPFIDIQDGTNTNTQYMALGYELFTWLFPRLCTTPDLIPAP